MKNPFPDKIRHIAIISPGSKPDRKKVCSAVKIIEGFGIKATIMPNVFAEEQGESMGSRLPSACELRIDDFNRCLNDSSVDLILCSRGGYGSAQLLDKIDWRLLKKRKLPLLGYSDITALHLAMYSKKAGIAVASPPAVEFVEALENPITVKSLFNSLSENSGNPPVQLLKLGKTARVFNAMPAAGKILPVNLAVFNSLLATPFLPDVKGHILLLEDINEEIYKLDRMLCQLQLAGLLSRCAGLLFGDFKKCGSLEDRNKVFAKFAGCVNGPVISGIPFGHIPKKFCFRFGQKIRITESGEIFW